MINNINGGRYYQWVGFVLLLQGILFLGPYMLWKFWEEGRVSKNQNDFLYNDYFQKHRSKQTWKSK